MTSSTGYVLYLFVYFATNLGPVGPSLSDRFGRIVAGLRYAVAAHSSLHHDLTPLMMLLWARLGRMDARFQALVARVRAGLPAPAPRKTSPSATPRRQTTRPAASPRLPQSYAWLVRLMLHIAAGYGSQLQYLLNDPEMPALLAAEPRLGRILRPLCNMLAVRPIPNLPTPPRRARVPRRVTPPRSAETATGKASTPARSRPPPRPGAPGPRARLPSDPWKPVRSPSSRAKTHKPPVW